MKRLQQGMTLEQLQQKRMRESFSNNDPNPIEEKQNNSSMAQFDFSYLKLNSLFKKNKSELSNRMVFSLTSQSQSKEGIVGVGQLPTEITQIRFGNIYMGRKFELATKIDDLEYGRLYIFVKEFSTQYYSSPEGFQYHFQYQMSIDPTNDLLLVGEPVEQQFSFPTPIRFNGELTFEFYTYKPYILQTDIYECYIDYTQPFLTLYKVDGSDHNLTNLDIISLNNFECSGLISADNPNSETYRQNQYRVSVLSATQFQIPIVITAQIAGSINRPADPNLGVYTQPIAAQGTPALNTIIQSPIPHGLQNGDSITISSVNNGTLIQIVQSWQVAVVSPTSFTIPFDSTIYPQQFVVTIASYPRIVPNRVNTIFVSLQTKKIEMSLQILSLSKTAVNHLIAVV